MNSTGNQGVGNQVLGELKGIVGEVVKDTAKAGGDIATATVEKVISGGQADTVGKETAMPVQGQERSMGAEEVLKQEKEMERRRALNRVRQELAEYIERNKQKKAQVEMVEERQEENKKMVEERRKESEREMVIRQAQRDYGGSRESARKGN